VGTCIRLNPLDKVFKDNWTQIDWWNTAGNTLYHNRMRWNSKDWERDLPWFTAIYFPKSQLKTYPACRAPSNTACYGNLGKVYCLITLPKHAVQSCGTKDTSLISSIVEGAGIRPTKQLAPGQTLSNRLQCSKPDAGLKTFNKTCLFVLPVCNMVSHQIYTQ